MTVTYDPFTREEWRGRLTKFQPGQRVVNFNLGLRGEVTKVGSKWIHFTDQYWRNLKMGPWVLHVVRGEEE